MRHETNQSYQSISHEDKDSKTGNKVRFSREGKKCKIMRNCHLLFST